MPQPGSGSARAFRPRSAAPLVRIAQALSPCGPGSGKRAESGAPLASDVETWPLAGFLGFLVDAGLRQFAQGLVGLFFFLERCLQQPNRLGQAEFLRPGAQRAVA
jgi:hypothetical protein